MSFSSHYRTLSPGDWRHRVTGLRASTGTVQLSSSYNQYEMPGSRYDYYDEYPSDTGYISAYSPYPGHSSMLEVQPVKTRNFRDPGQPAKRRTEYSLQPPTRHRGHTMSEADIFDAPAHIRGQGASHLRPAVSSGRRRSPSPLPPDSKHYLTASSHRDRRHRRGFSTDYTSDTGYLEPQYGINSRNGSHGVHRVHSHSGSRRHGAYDRSKKDDNADDLEAYSYTTPREQFDRDYPIKPRYPTGRLSVDRPASMNMTEEYPQWLARKDHRHHRPSRTYWGLDKIDHEGRPRYSARGVDDHRDVPRSKARGYDRSLVPLPRESDDEYESYIDSRSQRQQHRSSRHEKYYHDGDDRSSRLHNNALERALLAPGAAALGNGYSDTSDYDHRHEKHHRRQHDAERGPIQTQHSRRDYIDAPPPSSERGKLYLEPADRACHYSSRSNRRPRKHAESDEEGYTDDDDLRKYRHEPSATPGSRYSSTDISSDDNRSSRHRARERSHHSSSQRALQNGPSDGAHRSPSMGSKEYSRKPVTVDPPAPAHKEPETAPKSILKPPRPKFPEEPNPIREGVAPLKDATKKGIPPGARWTKIDRKLVNPAALEAGNERFEERAEYVIVLRVLSKEEIQAYAKKTREIRDAREKEYIREKRRLMDKAHRNGHSSEVSSSDDEDEGDDDDDDELLKLEAPKPPNSEQEKLSLPSRPRASSSSTTEPQRS